MITLDPMIDADALMAAPAEEKLSAARAYHAHFDPTNTQETRDAGGRFFYKVLLPYLSTARPN